MSGTQQTVAIGRGYAATRSASRAWFGGVHGADYVWAIAFALPYVAIFLFFVIYPICFGLWMGSSPALYAELFSDPRYLTTVVNTLLYVVIGVNLKMFLAFMLSGFFIRKRWWSKALLVVFILPWATPALPAYMSIHWFLNGQWGMLNSALYELFGIDGPVYLNEHWSGLASNIGAYIWKTLPFWTVILLAGRMSIPQDIYDAAKVDGATGLRVFAHVTFPLLANLYLVLTLLATIFLLGDFNSVYFVTGGGPANSTHLLATLGVVRDMLELGKPQLGVAVVMSALPLLIPRVIILMRKLRTAEVQL